MRILRLSLVAAALSLSASLAHAAPLNGYTSFIALGDSLTDNGNLFAATGGTLPPSPPYFNGRITNGPTWAEHVAKRFAAAGLFSANLAFGFANASPNADPVPDLPVQLFTAGTLPPVLLGSRPLASLWFGANDIFAELDVSHPILESAVAVAEAAADAVEAGALGLAALGIRDILLFNLPDLGRIPRFALFDPTDADKATAATDAFNARLALAVPGLRASGINVIGIDTQSLFDRLIDDPTRFGLTNATTPCFIPPASLCSAQEARDWAFFDQSHPNKRVHAILGQTVIAAAIPLPASAWLMLAGLAGLAALRRRAA